MSDITYKAIGIEQSFATWEKDHQIEGSFCFRTEHGDIEIYLNQEQINNLFESMKRELNK